MIEPTREAYGEMQQAYDFFNLRIFDKTLPNCLITMQREKKALGYFSPNRFESLKDATVTDEIAMNPEYFASRDLDESLSTLVHEMVHLWQYHFGESGRGGYHNKQWAQKMKSIGLHPSDTGAPGGKETGDRMTHYIMRGELFDVACKELIQSGFSLSWADHKRGPSRKTRVKYTCFGCATNFWAKPGVSASCDDCKQSFIQVE